MLEIYEAEGVRIDLAAFQRVELESRRVLHETIEEGSNGTEPELWHGYFVRLFEMSGVPEASRDAMSARVRDAHAALHLWSWALPRTGEALDALRAAGHRIGVVSNADGRMEDALVRAGVRDAFEFVIDSGTVGVEKPAPEIFHAGCEALGLEPAECLYVGDFYPVDYVGARAAGLGAVLLDPLGIHGARAATVPSLRALGGYLADFGGE